MLTLVPLVSLVKSRVVPEGTATLLRVMVAQEALDLLTAAAPLAPEKVQEPARLSSDAAAVGAGAAAGAATTREAAAPTRTADRRVVETILKS